MPRTKITKPKKVSPIQALFPTLYATLNCFPLYFSDFDFTLVKDWLTTISKRNRQYVIAQVHGLISYDDTHTNYCFISL